MFCSEALQRFNPCFCTRSWLAMGVTFVHLLSALVSSASEGAAGIPPEVRISNAATAYYLLLMGLAQAKLAFQQGWEKRYLPLQTVRNICWSLATMILIALHSPGIDPAKVQEKCVESWFGRCKAPYRGNPSIRDSIYAQHLQHLKQLASPATPAAFSATEISHETASACIDRAFTGAANLMQYLSYKVTAEQIQKNFKAWWRSEGHEMMTQGAGAAMDGDSDTEDKPVLEQGAAVETLDAFEEEAQEIDYEADDVAEVANQAELQLITSAEDHAAMKAELAALQEKVLEPLPAELPAPEPEASENAIVGCGLDAKSTGPSHEVNARNACWLSLQSGCEDLEEFDMQAIDAWTADRTLQRHHSLMGAMRQFASSVRQREGILSRTTVTGAAPTSEWNLLQHQLAKGRASTLLNGGRQSRSAAWMAVQDKVVAAAASTVGDGAKMAWRPDHLCPDTGKQPPQIVAFLDGQKKVAIGLVASVWRGAVTKKDGSTTRRMRSTRPSPGMRVYGSGACRNTK